MLGDARNIEGLQFVRKTLRGAKWKDHRRLIHDALIRAASFAGADVRELVPVAKEPLSVFAACWFLCRDRETKVEGHIPPIPSDLTREHYSLVENADVTSFFYDAFWIALYVGLRANGNDYSTVHPGLGKDDLGWLPRGLAKLEEIARNITEGRVVPAFSAIYTGADVEPVQWGPSPEREYYSIGLSTRLSYTSPLICISLVFPTPAIRRCQPRS